MFDVKLIEHYLSTVGSILDLDDKLVVILPDHVLTLDEMLVLSKGLSFCRTPGEADMGDLKRDLDRFHRNLHPKVFIDKETSAYPVENQPAPLTERGKRRGRPRTIPSSAPTLSTISDDHPYTHTHPHKLSPLQSPGQKSHI